MGGVSPDSAARLIPGGFFLSQARNNPQRSELPLSGNLKETSGEAQGEPFRKWLLMRE
jgi:hypothetical protein